MKKVYVKAAMITIGTVLDTKSLELAFLDSLAHKSAIINAMTIN